MKVAVLASVAWRTPPSHYGPWEQVASNVADGLSARGLDVTLFATKDSYTTGTLAAVVERGYEADPTQDAKVLESLHISNLMERAGEFDLIHNHFDFLPLTYSRLIRTPMVTTMHNNNFSHEKILPVYQKYNDTTHYVTISNAQRHPALRYLATIYHGIKPSDFDVGERPEDYLLFFGRIDHDKGAREAIQIAKAANRRLIIAGLICDPVYFADHVQPFIDDDQIVFEGNVAPPRRRILLSNAAALLHPLTFEEPFGLSVAEAMFSGTPVITFNRGSMPELVEQGVSGFLVSNVEDAVRAVAALPQINRRACHEYAAAKFGYETMIDKYIEAFRVVLGRTPRA